MSRQYEIALTCQFVLKYYLNMPSSVEEYDSTLGWCTVVLPLHAIEIDDQVVYDHCDDITMRNIPNLLKVL